MIIKNKLIRDKVIKKIISNNQNPIYKNISGQLLHQELIKKLKEEVIEFEEEFSIEELADVLEVIDGLILHLCIDKKDLKNIKKQKKRTHGGFENGIYLESVEK
ncbi:MAG: phosphoribosyl-ATP pyrophosphohydrolase [Patescibacteria group bacterium]